MSIHSYNIKCSIHSYNIKCVHGSHGDARHVIGLLTLTVNFYTNTLKEKNNVAVHDILCYCS